MRNKPLIEAKNINKTYSLKKQSLYALHNISITVHKGETLAIVGESGCGKSTLGKILINLEKPSSGSLYFQGNLITPQLVKNLRRHLQIIFQDPYASLNPRMNVEDIIGEGIDIHNLAKGEERRKRILDLLEQIGMPASALHKYPHEFSGGQRQRIVIARALAVDPTFIVCDEPISALDACTQQQVMQLLIKLKRERNLSYLFISHDLHAVRAIADNIAVMYLGEIVEYAPTEILFSSPKHPYTQALLSAIPIADPAIEKKRSRILLKGDLPSPLNPPQGCYFHPRCPHALDICRKNAPQLIQIATNHSAACHILGRT